MLSRDSNGKGLMHSKSGGEEVITGFHTEELIKELFHLLLHWYQVVLEQQMRDGKFVLDYVGRLFCKCYKISLDCDPKIDFPQWLKKKKATSNPPKYFVDMCSKYPVTTTLNHEKTGKNQPRISRIRPFVDQHEWKKINFPTDSEVWEKFETNSKLIALNVLFSPHNSEDIRQGYIFNHNSDREIQVFFQIKYYHMQNGITLQ